MTSSSREIPLADELFQRGADGTFAALETVIDCGVDEVDAAFDCSDDRFGVSIVRALVRLTKIGSDAQRRDDEAVRFAEMFVRRAASPFFGKAFCSFECGSSSHDGRFSPSVLVGSAFDESALSTGGARSLAQARIILL